MTPESKQALRLCQNLVRLQEERETARKRHQTEMDFARRARREGDMQAHAWCMEAASWARDDFRAAARNGGKK